MNGTKQRLLAGIFLTGLFGATITNVVHSFQVFSERKRCHAAPCRSPQDVKGLAEAYPVSIVSGVFPFYFRLGELLEEGTRLQVPRWMEGSRWYLENVSRLNVSVGDWFVLDGDLEEWIAQSAGTQVWLADHVQETWKTVYFYPSDGVREYVLAQLATVDGPLFLVSRSVYESRKNKMFRKEATP